MNESMQRDFLGALNKYADLKAAQRQREEDLKIEEPIVITTATAYSEKKGGFRGASDMQSTLVGSGSEGSQSDRGSNVSGRSRPSRKHTLANAAAAAKKVDDNANSMGKTGASFDDCPIEIDESTGIQMMKKDLQLTFQ